MRWTRHTSPSLRTTRKLQTNLIPTNGDPLHLSAFDYVVAQDSDTMYNGNCEVLRRDFIDSKFIPPAFDQVCNDRAGYFFPSSDACYVGWTAPGEFIEYEFSSSSNQEVDIVFRVAAQSAGKSFRARVGAQTRVFNVPDTGDWDNFVDLRWPKVQIEDVNNQRLRVEFITGDMNLCSISFTSPEALVAEMKDPDGNDWG
jgi:hypothetical protein